MCSASDQMMFQCPPSRPFPVERKWKSNNNGEVAPNCPRCASPNTKFCYYNNYSLSQPRYFCKGCRRYWTKGGSLRNVPVGGGCRKYRRAKSSSAKVSQNQRVASVNYGKNLNDPLVNPFSSNTDSMAQQGGTTDGSDIDLAVVFAKFLNHDQPEFIGQELPNEAHELVNVSASSTPDSCQNDHVMVGSQNPSKKSNSLTGDQKQQAEEERIQELMMIGSDVNAFGLQNLLSDEIVQDALWSEVATLPANVTWQPMVQLQDFDTFSVDCQPKISTSFMSDCNWNSLDFSGFEVFPRP